MRWQLVIALGALALSFALASCATAPGAHRPHTDAGDPGNAAKDLASHTADSDDESHRQTVVAHANDFSRCYNAALAKYPKLRGEVTLKWELDAAGDVSKEQVVGEATSITDKQMLTCMLERLHFWKFDIGPKDTVSTVVYPFYFSPPSR